MEAFEMSKYVPYRSVDEYKILRPDYYFSGRSAEARVAEALARCLAWTRGATLAECGCGPGPLWDLLPSHVNILAVEPNRELWAADSPPQVTYLEQDGFKFIEDHEGDLDVLAWMLAINYTLLAFFEHYDPSAKTVHLQDWLSAHHQCLDKVVALLERRASSDWVVLFFDGESAEQSFVTRVWEEVAPFPFHDRSHTRKILEMVFQLRAFRTGSTLEVTHLMGVADYGELDQAVERMMHFHLWGNFLDQAKIREQVRTFLAPFQVSGQVRCPAGAYLCHYCAAS